MDRNFEVARYKELAAKCTSTRSLTLCESLWNEITPEVGSLDQLIGAQLTIALSEERDEVKMLDLGSGAGIMLSQAANNSAPESPLDLTRAILEQFPQLKLKLFGLTDAKRKDDFLKRNPIAINPLLMPPPGQSQISAETIYFSITPRQTIADFMEAINVDNFNLITATSFFLHFYGGEFSQVLEDSIRALHSNHGKMVISEYCGTRKLDVDEEILLNGSGFSVEEMSGLVQLLEDIHNPFVVASERLDRIDRLYELKEEMGIPFNARHSMGVIVIDRINHQ